MNVGRGLRRLGYVIAAISTAITGVLLYGLAQSAGNIQPAAIGVAVGFGSALYLLSSDHGRLHPKTTFIAVILIAIFIPVVANWSVQHVAADATAGLIAMLGLAPVAMATLMLSAVMIAKKSVAFLVNGFR